MQIAPTCRMSTVCCHINSPPPDASFLPRANARKMVQVYEESGKFIANPNITSTTASLKASESNTTWTDLSFYIPKSSGQPLGFTTNTNSAEVTTGSWHFYGEYAFIENSAGQLESHFFAQPTDVDGVYNILWSVSDQAQLASPEIKSISIRTIPPASG
jgi:hypothetical protein